MDTVKKVVHILSLIIYGLVSIYVVICIPMIFKYKPLVVLTGSMEPSFKVGSIVYYKRTNIKDLKVGDAITFKLKDGTIVSHRIEKINDDSFVTKGDANNTVDHDPVPFERVLGKDTKFCIPLVGYYVRFVNSNLFVLIPIILILISEFLLSNKNFDIDNEERREELDYGTRTNTTKEE